MTKTYLLDGTTEVTATGRTAKKKIAATTRVRERIEELIEVEPVDNDVEKWKKWVPRTRLYEIEYEMK